MSKGQPIKPDFAGDLFAGTARYYADYRVPYAEEMLEDLRGRASVTGAGRLGDLAGGPGRVSIRMASYFKDILAIDHEPEMIEVGRTVWSGTRALGTMSSSRRAGRRGTGSFLLSRPRSSIRLLSRVTEEGGCWSMLLIEARDIW